MQISKRTTQLIILVLVIKQLIFINKNPVINGYHIESELNDILKSVYSESPLGYNNVDWFVDDVIKLETKTAFYFINTNKDSIITEENEEGYRKNNTCGLCEK